MARAPRVFIDTNELFPFTVMDTLLTLAEERVITWVWTDELLAEWETVIVREGRRTPLRPSRRQWGAPSAEAGWKQSDIYRFSRTLWRKLAQLRGVRTLLTRENAKAWRTVAQLGSRGHRTRWRKLAQTSCCPQR